MSSEEFETLNIDDRANYVWDNGSRIIEIEYYNHVVILYAMPSFFVEVFYHPEELKITGIELLNKENPRFGLYLEKIDIVKLLNA